MHFVKSILIWCFLASRFAYAQPPMDWAKNADLGGNYQDYITDIYIDAAGNTYACGNFRNNLQIGSSPLSGSGISQAFVVKYDNTGTPLWATQSQLSNQTVANSIFVDVLGNCYVVGTYSSTAVQFGGFVTSSNSMESFYIVKITPFGDPFHISGPTAGTTGKSKGLSVTGDGDHVYILGEHSGTISLPGGPSLPAAVGEYDVFITRIDSAFTAFDYAFTHGGNSYDRAAALTIRNNDLFATGSYGNAVSTFNAGTDYDLPAYGHEAIWVASFNKVTGVLGWANSAGSANGPSRANDLTIDGFKLFVTGSCSDVCAFNSTPSFTGPFVYNDTIYSNGEMDIFVARYNLGGAIQQKWSEGGPGHDEAFGIDMDNTCTENVQLCGSFEDSVNFNGSTMLHASGTDMFVAAYDDFGTYQWAFNEISATNEQANAIAAEGGRTSIGGEYYGDIYFGTNPMTELSWNGYSDFFISSFQCGSVPTCAPIITNCPSNDTVTADVLCQYILGDYLPGLVVTDACGTGITPTQNIPATTIIGPGNNQLILTATDGSGNTDVCLFDVVVLTDADPILVECGDSFTAATSGGNGNTFNTFSCSPISTPGQDQIYQVYVEAGTHFLSVKMDNAIDANDPYAYVYWLDDNCPNSGTCAEIDSFNVATDQFSNNTNYLTFIADGPGTYYLVVDAKTDSIESYDISFSCSSSGVEFDGSSCPGDPDGDGYTASVSGSIVDLTMQPCESVQICHDLYLANQNDWEWVDSIEMQLGDCYENINVATLSPDGGAGFFDAGGTWDAVYSAGTNSILWEFNHSSGNNWGDGPNSSPYSCASYTLCFDADIKSTCANSEGLTIGITVGDDGDKLGGAPSNVYDIVNSNNFILQDDDPTFTYPATVLCNGDPVVSPDMIASTGWLFTASPGIVFTDGSPSPTGEIDLTASTIGGPYTITHTSGLCPFTHDFVLNINAQEDATFSFGAPAYCQDDTDPTPTITGTSGGTFSGPSAIVFISTTTGQIDLDASTAGGPYYIVYTTPGPNCINADSVQLTINAEDDPSFSYTSNSFCQGDTDPLPTISGTTGGTFNVLGGLNLISPSTGEIDVSASSVGGPHTVEYTTPGPNCPNTTTFLISINSEDDPAFNYTSIAYCQGDANPVANITGTGGGTFTGPASISFVSTTTGEIDLAGSTAGGPYTITYTTPGPLCPNSSTFDITINAEDDPAFNYTTNTFCSADANQVPVITGTSGGTFSGPVGINFVSTATGEVDVSASTIGGPYTITYTTSGPDCPNSSDVIVNVFVEDDPTMSYAGPAFCANEIDPVATVALAGGTFTGPASVSFVNTTTGEIDLDASAAGGPYEIIYTSPGPECPNTDTAFVTINALDDPSFIYADSLLCTIDGTGLAIVSGTSGGVFSADAEISIDISTGTIDLNLSTVGGPYEVKYVTLGTCPDSSLYNVYLYDAPVSNAGPDQNIFFVSETSLAALNPTNGTGIWTIISGSGDLDDDTDSASVITNLPDGQTELQWTVSNEGCPDAIDNVLLNVSDLFIPEALTPNNDGQNDLFAINGIEDLENHVEIFNRWGQKVFDAINYQNDWDGTDESGKEMINDTYFYIINVDESTYKGFVVLKR
jgi:gliding motility-associated-like protein